MEKVFFVIHLRLNFFLCLVCPADWEETKPSINTKTPGEYFSKQVEK
jgi:hypothetical protein